MEGDEGTVRGSGRGQSYRAVTAVRARIQVATAVAAITSRSR